MILLLAGCTSGQIEKSPVGQAPVNISIRYQTRAGSEEPVVNSVRILAFAGTSGSETCVLNQYNPFGFTLSEESDIWTVKLTSEIPINSTETQYKLYAVINEADYSVSSSQTLSMALNDFENGSSLSDFEDLVETPVQYAALKAGGSEPAFLMYAHKDVEITDFDSATDIVFDATGTGSVQAKRSMAQIVIDKITSEPVSGHTSGADVPKVFVLGVWIDNVPAGTAWGTEDGSLGSATPVSIKVGAANESTGYYDRKWSGHVTEDITVNATRTEATFAKYWRTGDNTDEKGGGPKKNEKWSFGSSTAYTYTSGKSNPNANDKKNAYNAAVTGAGLIDNTYAAGNTVGTLIGALAGQFGEGMINYTEFENNSIVSGSEANLTVSPDYWTVNLNEGYYVPENIATSAAGSTCIKVRVAVAHPALSAASVTVADISKPTALNDGTLGTFSYTLDGYNLQSAKINYLKPDNTYSEREKNWVPDVFKDNGHVVYSDDIDYEVIKPDDEGDNWYDDHDSFKVYVDGFCRVVDGQATVQITDRTPNAVFSWNITPTDYVDITIPVSSDFCVRRNTRYTITLHVDDTTWANNGLSTRSSKSGRGITAIVKTEKICDDEK